MRLCSKMRETPGMQQHYEDLSGEDLHSMNIFAREGKSMEVMNKLSSILVVKVLPPSHENLSTGSHEIHYDVMKSTEV